MHILPLRQTSTLHQHMWRHILQTSSVTGEYSETRYDNYSSVGTSSYWIWTIFQHPFADGTLPSRSFHLSTRMNRNIELLWIIPTMFELYLLINNYFIRDINEFTILYFVNVNCKNNIFFKNFHRSSIRNLKFL